MEDGLHPEPFKRQMGFLSENGYNIVALDQALNHLAGSIKLPPKSIAITVDGGYRDAYTNVLPVLKSYNFHATFFIIPECIGGERTIKGISIPCLNWDEIREIAKCGSEIGLLAYGGRGIKGRYDEESVKQSISNSLKAMAENYSGDIRFCAFREGVAEKSLWDFLKNRGFQAVFTQCPTNRRLSLAGIGRIQIDDDDHNIFLAKISKIYLFFKDKRSWKYIRKYKIDKLAHRISETVNAIRGE